MKRDNSMKVSELEQFLEKVVSIVKTDEDANMLRYVKECILYTQNTLSLPNCNDCGLKNCKYKPRWGSPVRINCPFWKSKN